MCLVELISGLILVCLVAVLALTGPLSLMSHWALLVQHFPDISTMTKWFHSTRLETRTKESNTCANSWVVKLVGTMKVIIEMLALVAD